MDERWDVEALAGERWELEAVRGEGPRADARDVPALAAVVAERWDRDAVLRERPGRRLSPGCPRG